MHPQRVGKSFDGTNKHFTYVMCKCDFDGWIKAKEYLPDDYDICYVKTHRGISKRAWYSGYAWDGAHIKDDDEVVLWKRSKELEE